MEDNERELDLYIQQMIDGWLGEDFDYYEFEQGETDTHPI